MHKETAVAIYLILTKCIHGTPFINARDTESSSTHVYNSVSTVELLVFMVLYHVLSSVSALMHVFWTRWDGNRKLRLYRPRG